MRTVGAAARQLRLSAIVAKTSKPRARTLPAINRPYLPFDLPVERFIQSLNWVEGTLQQCR